MSEITTTARRITREINSYAGHSNEWKLYFDADGRQIGEHEAGQWYAERPDWMDDVHLTRHAGRSAYGTIRATQRDIQDHLDIIAEAATEVDVTGLDARDAAHARSEYIGYRLAELDHERSQR